MKRKKLSEESDLTILKEYNNSCYPSYREMIYFTWMAAWFYLDIYRGFWWFFLGFTILAFFIFTFDGTKSKLKVLRDELKRRGF